MKNAKRLIAGLLAAVMMISSVQMTAYAAEEDVVESETEVVEDTKADETVAADEADEADDVVETQTVAAEVTEDTDVDTEETVAVMATIEDTDDNVVADEETVATETVISEDIETVIADEETTEQISDEETVETEIQALDADLTANVSVDYDTVEKYVHDQLLAKRRQNQKAETITVDVSSYKIPWTSDADIQKIYNVMKNLQESYNDLYFLKRGKDKFSYQQNILTKITFSIDTEKDDAAFQKAVNEALSHVNNNMSDFQKIVILHDWLALHCTYDKNSDERWTAYAALVNCNATCQGYAVAYRYLLDCVGIENYLISCDSMNHSWNLVELEGKYYHVDVSADDTHSDNLTDVQHYFLLISDEYLRNKYHRNYDWQVTTDWSNSFNIKATSTLYDNASWRNRITTTIMDDIFDDEPETYTITYVLNGGTNNSENPATYTKGTRVEFKNPVKDGYQFDGWYKDPDFNQQVKALSENCAKDYIVYAKWIKIESPSETETSTETETKIESPSETETSKETETSTETETSSDVSVETYTITYELNGGTNNSENPATYTKGTEIRFKDAVKDGYQFDGWYLNADFTNKVEALSKYSSGNKTIYAKWIENETPETSDTTEETETETTTQPAASKTFKVTFNTNGHGEAPKSYTEIEAGSTIAAPTAPTASGYRFDGWYKNAVCTKAWDFESDTVQANTTLYAKWVYEGSNELDARDIPDMYYTGSACKPEVDVYDEDTLLRAGKDYQVKYYNNVNANVGGALKNDTFNAALPYVEITGKGNYTGTVKVNFNILKAPISDEYGNPAGDVVLKVTDIFVTSNKVKKPFSSIKFGKAMKQNVDFTLRLTADDGKELSGAVIPAGVSGTFTLEIIGKNNYEGAIERTIYVADKASLPKYEKFTAGTISVSGITDKVYTGKAQVQENVTLTFGGRQLVRGADYTVSYAKNVNKGTATMTFKGLEKAGFSGSFKKTFKITAADITSASYTPNLTASYSKAGAKPEIRLTNNGKTLVNGRDYTLSYANNKAVGSGTVTVKGKGNYTGTFSVPFGIVKADLNDLTVKTVPVAYNAKKAADYAYNPAIKLLDGRSALRAGVDYEIVYQNNTQAEYDAYRDGRMSTPCAIITAKEGSAYKLDGQIVIPLPIYQNKFTKNNVSVKVEQSECVYTGRQVKPSVEVRYMGTLLTEGRDYTVSYGENKVSGKNKGSVTISGAGPNYGGDVTVKFEILRKAICY